MVAHWLRLGKRRQALLESNLPRNTQPQTHRGRWEGRGVKAAPFDLVRGRPTGGSSWPQAEDVFKNPHRTDRSRHASENSKPRATTSTRVVAIARTRPVNGS